MAHKMIFNATFRCGNMLQAFESDSKKLTTMLPNFVGLGSCNTLVADPGLLTQHPVMLARARAVRMLKMMLR